MKIVAHDKITLYGMCRYLADSDHPLFEFMELPSGVDKELLIDVLMLQGSDMELMYPDADYCRMFIGIWSKKWYHSIEKWYQAINLEYDPIYNYDRYEKWTENTTGTTTDKSSGSSVGESEEKVSAYNSSSYEPSSKSGSSAESSNSGQTDTNLTNTREGRAYGNIGVTTSQQMLESELDINYWNFYEKVADLFLGELCVFTF